MHCLLHHPPPLLLLLPLPPLQFLLPLHPSLPGLYPSLGFLSCWLEFVSQQSWRMMANKNNTNQCFVHWNMKVWGYKTTYCSGTALRDASASWCLCGRRWGRGYRFGSGFCCLGCRSWWWFRFGWRGRSWWGPGRSWRRRCFRGRSFCYLRLTDNFSDHCGERRGSRAGRCSLRRAGRLLGRINTRLKYNNIIYKI